MTMAMLEAHHGKAMFTAVMRAFSLFSLKGSVLEGFTLADTLRHGLGVHLLTAPSEKMSDEILKDYVTSFEPGGWNYDLFDMLLDSDHIAREFPSIRMQYGVCESTECTDAKGHSITCVAAAVILTETIDVWHAGNKASPGHRCIRKKLRKGVRNSNTVLKVEEEPCHTDRRQDDEFQAMSFEEALRREKMAGGWPRLRQHRVSRHEFRSWP
jgi:hypothetical protein